MTSVARFVGSIPAIYDRFMGPTLFEPYAQEMAARLPAGATRVLEIACGTGRVTRHLLGKLPADNCMLVATDLNEPMIEEAKKTIVDPRLTWRAADAQALPFPDAAFDAIVCQFGLMFVPDKLLAMREMKRVLAPGGTLLLAVWDSLANNPASQRLHQLAFSTMVDNPPTFMALPFSMHDARALDALAAEARFSSHKVDTVAKEGVAATANDLATGFVRGNPLYLQLMERSIDADAFQAQVAATLAAEFGDSPCKSPMSAHVLTAVA
jgi:ubiquinone/menaquinone biosynthesis C-methylase UbiE